MTALERSPRRSENETSYPDLWTSFAHLGLPDYFKLELTIAKVVEVFALLIPNVPQKMKEFAYFGFAITLISASIAHFSSVDGMMFVIDHLLFLAALIVSHMYFLRMASA
jgi:hypothetical protein